MHRLPVKPARFLLVYWGLALSGYVPCAFLNTGSPPAVLALAFAWLCLTMLLVAGWQGAWIWRAVEFASSAAVEVPGPDPGRTRTFRWLASAAAVGMVILGPLQWRFIQGGPVAQFPMMAATLLVLLTMGGATWVAARAICDAERKAQVGPKQGQIPTAIQLVYLPLVAPLLYRRLSAVAGSSPARPEPA